jgi:hypothetical protein
MNMTEEPTVEINGNIYGVLSLAALTYGSPRTPNGVGAAWLWEIADDYRVNRDEILDEYDEGSGSSETLDGIADSRSHPSTEDTWRIAVNLNLFREIDNFDQGLWADRMERNLPQAPYREELWAVPADKLTEMLQWWLYETAQALLSGLLFDDRKRTEEAETETEGENE